MNLPRTGITILLRTSFSFGITSHLRVHKYFQKSLLLTAASHCLQTKLYFPELICHKKCFKSNYWIHTEGTRRQQFQYFKNYVVWCRGYIHLVVRL